MFELFLNGKSLFEASITFELKYLNDIFNLFELLLLGFFEIEFVFRLEVSFEAKLALSFFVDECSFEIGTGANINCSKAFFFVFLQVVERHEHKHLIVNFWALH